MLTPREQKILAQLHPDLLRHALKILEHVNSPGKLPPGVALSPHTGYRSLAAQLLAYARGVTKIKRGKHNRRPAYACDLVWLVNGKWSWSTQYPFWLIGYWAEDQGLTWGGRWGTPQAERAIEAHHGMRLGWDPVHVELPG